MNHMNKLPSWILSVAVFGLITSTTQAEDWPKFRGPTGQGISQEKNVPVEWSPEKNVAWRVPIEGDGWSSPAYVDGRIYLTSAVPTDDPMSLARSLRTLCLDAANGKTLWNVEVFQQSAEDAQKIHKKNSHASPTAIVSDGKVYVHFGSEGSACLTTGGDIVWKNEELTYRMVHGNGGSPVLVDGVLFFSADGASKPSVMALDAKTGELKWKKQRPPIVNQRNFSFSTPLVISLNGKTQVISPGSNQVIAYDPKTGDHIWQADYDGYSVIPCPVYGNGLVYVSTSYNKPSLHAIDPTGTGNITKTHIRWSSKRGVSHTPSFLVLGKELYFVSDSGVASCVDAVSGEQHWQERLGGNYSSSPVSVDGRIYFQSEQGDATVIKQGTTFELVAKNSLGERSLSSYAVADSSLFIRTDTHLYRISK